MKRILAILTAIFMLAALPCFAEVTEEPDRAISLSNLVVTAGETVLDLSALNLTIGGGQLDEGTIASLIDVAANDESALTLYLLASIADGVLVATAASGENAMQNAVSIDMSSLSSASDVDVNALVEKITALAQQIGGILAGAESSEPENASYTFHGAEEAVAGTVTVTALSEEQVGGIISALAEVIPNINAEDTQAVSVKVSQFTAETGDATATVIEFASAEHSASITLEMILGETGYTFYGEAVEDENALGYCLGALDMSEGTALHIQAFDAGDNQVAEITAMVASDEDGYTVTADLSAQGNVFSLAAFVNPAEMAGHLGVGYYTAVAESEDMNCVFSVDVDVALSEIDVDGIPAVFEGKDVVTVEDIQDSESAAYQDLMTVVGTAMQKLAAIPAIGALLGAGQE